MAERVHWEWRAFGPIGDATLAAYGGLPESFPPASFTDRYLWRPGCRVNVKLREGDESGLKFKTLQRVVDELELWREEEPQDAPFTRAQAERVVEALDVDPPDAPREGMTRAELTAWLEAATPPVRIVTVEKERESRIFDGPHGAVKVEIATILAPVQTSSVGLENDAEAGAPPGTDEAAIDLRAAIEHLGLPGDMRVMSYLDALEAWAR